MYYHKQTFIKFTNQNISTYRQVPNLSMNIAFMCQYKVLLFMWAWQTLCSY